MVRGTDLMWWEALVELITKVFHAATTWTLKTTLGLPGSAVGARVLRTDGTAHVRAGAKVKRLGATSCFFSVARMNDAILH